MMQSDIQIIDASPNDSEGINAVTEAVWMDSYPNVAEGITEEDIRTKLAFATPEEKQKNIADRAKRIQEDTKRHYWVAKDRDKVVGYCAAKKGSDENVLQALNILPDYQGKGIGTQLMEQALAWLGDALPITLRVVQYNTNAIHFYERFGFTATGKSIEVPNEFTNGKVIPRIELKREKNEKAPERWKLLCKIL